MIRPSWVRWSSIRSLQNGRNQERHRVAPGGIRQRLFALESFAANVVAEIKGRERPEEVVVVGGHLDSWDVGQGAQDDGSGIMATFESGLSAREREPFLAWPGMASFKLTLPLTYLFFLKSLSRQYKTILLILMGAALAHVAFAYPANYPHYEDTIVGCSVLIIAVLTVKYKSDIPFPENIKNAKWLTAALIILLIIPFFIRTENSSLRYATAPCWQLWVIASGCRARQRR